MNQSSTRWKACALRLVTAALVIAMLGSLVGSAMAQDSTPTSEAVAEQPSFVWQVLTNLFDSRGLMQILSQPRYTFAAFLVVNLIVFTETGLLIGCCLPGDSLLVTVGLIASNPLCEWNLSLLLVTLCASAIAGDTVGYAIGFKTGPKIFTREKSLFFNRDHLLKAREFYERHGGITIVVARFIPILRAFAPVVAGVGQMEYRQFVFYNVFGGIGWVVSMVLIGYFLPDAVNPLLRPLFGPEFLVQDHVEKIVILVAFASVTPPIIAWLRTKMARPVAAPELAEAAK